jgi:transposase
VDKDAVIAGLRKEIAELREINAMLLDRIARLEKNSRTSSRPPSSDLFKTAKAEADADQKKADARVKSKNKKARKDKARARAAKKQSNRQRTPFPADRVDEVVEYEVTDLDPDLWEQLTDRFSRFQTAELVANPLWVTEFRLPHFRNRETGAIFIPAYPDDLKNKQLLQPRLLAYISLMKAQCHVSYSKIQTLLADVFGLSVSDGCLVNATYTVAKALDQPYEDLLEAAKKQKVVNIDETSHKEKGKLGWVWGLTCPALTVFRVADTRSTDELYELLGHDFNGVIGSDFFGAYRKFLRENGGVESQFCWAHLIREVLFVAGLDLKRFGLGVCWSEMMLKAIRKLFKAWHRRQIRACQRARTQILRYCDPGWLTRCPEAEKLQARLRNYAESYFLFIERPAFDVEPTNNSSERVIRTVVMHRKATQGTRSEKGRRFWERLFSVGATLKQQGRGVFDYLVEALESSNAGVRPPSPLPAMG